MNNYLTTEDEKNFIRSTYALHQEGKKNECKQLAATGDDIQAACIIAIEKLVYDIIKCKDDIFYIFRNKLWKGISCKDKSILDRLKRYGIYGNINIEDMDSSFSIHKYSPYVKLFTKTFIDKNIYIIDLKIIYSCQGDNNQEESDKKLQAMVDTLNNFIESIKKEAGSQQFKTELYEHKRLMNDNHKSLLAYINKLFVRYSRLLVLRIDLGYKRDVDTRFLNETERYAKYSEAREDREHLFNNMRSNKLFDDLFGYAWKLEYAARKGFHYHMLFFFNGAKVQRDISIARMIGEYWSMVITKGNGLYYNCNAKKQEYKQLGIGMIDRKDIELRKGLEVAARYLTKTDYYAKINAKDIGKTFAKGEIEPNVTNIGRPTVEIQQERYSSDIALIEQLVHGIIQSEELFCVCNDKENKRYYYIGANDDFMRDVLEKIRKYKNKTVFIDWILSLSVHPTVALFVRNLKDRLVVVKPHLYNRRRNRSRLENYDVRVLNEFIESIRDEARSPQFIKAINDYYNRPISS